jgi:hypothetical protein
MGVFEGLLSGFTGRKSEVEQENLRQAELANAREAKIYEALVNSPDPEIRTMAVTGLLDSAKPGKRKSGLRGWIGEMEANPALGRIKDLIGTPVTSTESTITPGLPSVQTSGYLSTPPGQQSSLAMPEGNAVTPGQPPIAPVESRLQSEIVPGPAVGRTDTQSITRPREAFRSPEEQTLLTEEAQARGTVRGRVAGRQEAGFTPEEARELERRQQLGGTAGQSYAEGNIVADPTSETGYSQELYLRANPKIRHRIPAQPPLTPETAGARAAAVTTARAGAAANVPLTTQQRFQATTGLIDDWRRAEAPVREMQRQHQLMTTGLDRFRQGDKIGGSQAVLITFQKILDPTSVVRESEYARSAQGLGLMQRIEGMYERLKAGGAGVPEAELAGMVETARQFIQGMEGWNAAERQRIGTLATDYGVEPSRIFGGAQGVGAPPPGARQTPGASGGLDTPVAGWYVDDAGNLVQR